MQHKPVVLASFVLASYLAVYHMAGSEECQTFSESYLMGYERCVVGSDCMVVISLCGLLAAAVLSLLLSNLQLY